MNEAQDIRKMMDYAREIEADPEEFSRALSSVTIMDQEKFVHIGEALFLFSPLLIGICRIYVDKQSVRWSCGTGEACRDCETRA
ncbi:MAG: hypothetical protein R3E08_07645 [Thiotrichaceae bacterium]